ncbi:odorant receptor 131-2-like [Pleurodeles waltl]|uniref:odorant receptor 131-2-like n=1 Tax=Pleurodeles waltl TaxID=8319 RepID=UPI003709A416
MENFSVTSVNNTQAIVSITKLMNVVAIAPFMLFFIFLYFILQMLKVFCTTPRLRDNSRYILFTYLMVNDTVYLFLCILLLSFTLLAFAIPTLACYIIVALTSSTFSSTPNGLAAMALERYVAICYPLRHAEICRVERSLVVIGMICIVGLLPYLVDSIILVSSVNANFFFQKVMCSREALFATTLQTLLRFVAHGSIFTVVALVILFTYIQIVLETKMFNANKASSSKASKTVILHAVQLLLCMMSFTYPITESYFQNRVVLLRFFNMLAFTILPRFLSPLIYGLRDEAFRNQIKICAPRGRHKTHP